MPYGSHSRPDGLHERYLTPLNRIAKSLYDDQAYSVRAVPEPSLVEDATHRFIILNARGEKEGFVLVSNEAFPDSLKNVYAVQSAAVEALGPDLSTVIVMPIDTGYVEGNSYSICRYYPPLRNSGVPRLLARKFIAAQVCGWVIRVAERSTRLLADREICTSSEAPLRWLMSVDLLPEGIKDSISRGLTDLDNGSWKPSCVFSHNDLWAENVLVESYFGETLGSWGIGRPRIIDWGGSSVTGIPFFDLIRFMASMGYSAKQIRMRMDEVTRGTGGDYSAGRADLLAGLGRLGMNRGQFPLHRFASMVRDVIAIFERATNL